MELNVILNEQAYLNNSANGNWKDRAYTAKGTVNGLPCKIWWENINPEAEDESDCCDWEVPYLIELESQFIDPDQYEIIIIR